MDSAAPAPSKPERLSSLATPSATRRVLEAHGLYTKHGLGQNFLVSDDVLRKIAALSELAPQDYVLEVGPGIGTLSEVLLKCAGEVVAVERDGDLEAVLSETLASWHDRFTLVHKDALDLTRSDIANRAGRLPNKFVSNLPYAVAATVVLDFFERFPSIESATVMVQKEVADRMAAVPGTKEYGAYTVKLGLFASVAGRFNVAPGNFFPPPHVESTVIRLNRTVPRDASGNPVPDELRQAACTMADAAFANRRKNLANSCKAYFRGRGDAGKRMEGAVASVLEAAGIDARRRGETLSQQEFIALGQAYLLRQANL